MKMYKKAIMLLLALVVIFAAGVVVSADTTTTLTDDFNVYTGTKDTNFKNGYPDESHTSDILKARVDSSGKAVISYFQLAYGKGTDETTALRINAGTSYEATTYLDTKPFDSTTGDTIVLTYDMRIDEHNGNNPGGENYASRNTTLAAGLFEMRTGQDTINPIGTDKGDNFQYEIGKWYNVVIVRDNASISAYIVDGETGETCTYSKKSSAGKANDFMTLFNVPAMVKANRFDAYIDNLVMSTYNPEIQAPSVTDISVEDGETGVLLNREITVEFDQVFLDDKPEPVVLADGDPVITNVEKLSSSKVKITFDTLLKRNTEYTISFDEVTNGFLACNSGDITFTTEDLHLWNDVEITPVEAGPVTDIAFRLGEEYGYPTYTGKVLVIAYKDGVMTSIIPLTLTDEDISAAITKEVPLGILESGDEIKVVLVDDVNGIVPLALGSTTVQ